PFAVDQDVTICNHSFDVSISLVCANGPKRCFDRILICNNLYCSGVAFIIRR
ncbi:MAG: hypothetical protein ACI83E_001738, partial [Sulfitobacter sp.]